MSPDALFFGCTENIFQKMGVGEFSIYLWDSYSRFPIYGILILTLGILTPASDTLLISTLNILG